ncbi:MAG: YqgE/AlgH family protein [Gammaproteobacteria bacterium]|nr:YqgE/AlgH family protein [Gammaproteobacteria bacterium]
MNERVDLTNHFLIAIPGLSDANFFHTATYICEHNEEGAMGIVINRPTDMKLNEILDQLEIDQKESPYGEQFIYLGGPVQTDRGFVLHTNDGRQWESTLNITQEISVTTSRDILRSIIAGEGPRNTLIALGYAGWTGGQLEEELGTNAWLNGPADEAIIFELPDEKRWEAAAGLLGIDLNLLSGETGHA